MDLRKILVVCTAMIFVILIGIFFTFIAAGKAYIPSITDGQMYAINLPYNVLDPLNYFVKQGDTIVLYSNCAQLSGCSFWGLWIAPFQLMQNGDGSYTVIYVTSTVVNEYKFVPLDGGVDVFARHDQCYPNGCQNPPLQYIGHFT